MCIIYGIVHRVRSIGRPSGGLGRIRAGENDATTL